MEFFLALIFSLFVSAVAYFVIRKSASRLRILKRLATKGGSPFPYAVSNKVGGETSIALKSPKWDKKTKKIVSSGLQGKQNIQMYNILRAMSLLVPLAVIGVDLIRKKSFTQETLLYSVVGCVAFTYVSRMFVIWVKKKRQNAILRTLPQFLDLTVVCVEAGLGFAAALERVLKEMDRKEPLTQELSLMYSEFLGGLSLGDACGRLDKRCSLPDLSLLLSSIVQSDQMGTGLGKSLRIQSADMRDKYRQRLRTKALKIPIKILGPVMLVFLNVMIVALGPVMYALSKQSF